MGSLEPIAVESKDLTTPDSPVGGYNISFAFAVIVAAASIKFSKL